jgi:hypothetical protein
MGLGDSQVRQEEGDWLGAHRGATIGRQGELTRQDASFDTTPHLPDTRSADIVLMSVAWDPNGNAPTNTTRIVSI